MSKVLCRTLWILRNMDTGKFFRSIHEEDTGNKLRAQRFTSKPEAVAIEYITHNSKQYSPEVLVTVEL